jgi:hypothetical protein
MQLVNDAMHLALYWGALAFIDNGCQLIMRYEERLQ